jgi:polyferredoxin
MALAKRQRNIIKLLYQVAVFAALFYMGIRLWIDKVYVPDFEAYCPFGGLQALGSFINLNSLSCSMTTMQIMMGVMLFIGAAFFSKLFCSYICPVGTISEWLGKLGDRLKIRVKISESVDSSLKALKYMLLFVTFYFTLTSSELFCKKFDPYYAAATGFGPDVVLLYALITIAVLIVGSILFRFFWCRYLCPFGALTNIFRFFWWFAALSAVFVILSLTGLKIPFVYPLLAITCAGYILEIIRMKKVAPSVTYISRDIKSCTNCNLCSVNCPQEIDVAKMERVTHIDCNLCGDCLYVCPEKDTLQINRRNMKWLPGVVLAALIILGIVMGSLYELPTINVRWGTEEQIANAGTFTKDGLKNIKCFGSSTTFANNMREVEGIYGVSTYVGTNTVKVLYDKSIYNDTTLQKLIFIPQKKIISEMEPWIDSVAVLSLTVDNFFDPLDASYLQYLLLQKTAAYSYQSEFACPVIIRVYFPLGNQTEPEALADIIESKTLLYQIENDLYKVNLKYRVVTVSDKPEIISRQEYIDRVLN